MSKAQRIAHCKRTIKQAQVLQNIAMQNFTLAAQIESEATSELEALGASAPSRKGKELSAELQTSLRASLTTKRKN